ncbi:GGDEF domain-containing protein [Actinoplanes philippinensis]|uniref:GGDEF domain-containing protein n=1 Tax=Actinoplanes philippinensis TaxID=35752 RepID=UPI0033C1508D
MKLWSPRALPLAAAVLGVPTLLAPESAVARLTYPSAFFVVVVSAWLAARAETGHRLSRALVAGALTVWLAGDLVYSALTRWFGEPGDVSLADAFWITGYPLLAAGLIIMVRRRTSSGLREATLDGLAMATVVGVLFWRFMVQPEITGDTMSAAEIIGTFYPLGDVLLFVAGALLVLAPGVRGGATGYLLAALAITLTGDVVITVLPAVLPDFDTGRLDALLLLANSLFAAALWNRDIERPADRRTGPERVHAARLVFLGVALIALPVLNQLNDQDDGALGHAVSWSASILLSTIIFVRFVLVVREQEQARTALAHRAAHDELTGLVNRQELYARLTLALQQGAEPVVHFLDLDGFKAVNDRHGHSAGDFVLAEVARRLLGQTRPSDIVARLGGDEFVVVTEDAPGAGDVPERLRAAVGAEMSFRGHRLRVGVSIGVVSAADLSRPDSDVLLGTADEAMYRQKRTHRRTATGRSA